MNQNQRKYALERIENVVRSKIVSWESENPMPSGSVDIGTNGSLPCGHTRSGDPRLQKFLQMAEVLRPVIEVGFIPLDTTNALAALDRYVERVNDLINSPSGTHKGIPPFVLTSYAMLPENTSQEVSDIYEEDRRQVRDWSQRKASFVNRLQEFKDSLKDEIMLGDANEALAALRRIEAFDENTEV